MNERIEDILAGLDIDLYTDEGVLMTSVLVSPKDLRKFAELIVKDAGALLMSPEFIGRSDLDWSMVLNEHFGVE